MESGDPIIQEPTFETEPRFEVSDSIPFTGDLWADGRRVPNPRPFQLKLNGKKHVQVVDLFAGGGGFTEGAIRAGGDVVLAVDSWIQAERVHRLNHPKIPFTLLKLGGSIPETAAFIRSHLEPYSHFHLHGSPPCQKLSNASSGDPEEGMILVNWFIELVRYMEPDSWSMENVLPMAKRLPRGLPYDVLNAAHFGVPQTRKRVFAGVGWFAEPSHFKENWVSVLDALPYLENEIYSISQTRIVSRRRKKNEAPQSYPPTSPAHTITQVRHIIEDVSNALKGEVIRTLTVEEAAILQGFKSFRYPKDMKKKELGIIVGNAVCPPVAEAIIRGIL